MRYFLFFGRDVRGKVAEWGTVFFVRTKASAAAVERIGALPEGTPSGAPLGLCFPPMVHSIAGDGELSVVGFSEGGESVCGS